MHATATQAPFQLASPPARQPIQWRRTWRLLNELVADPDSTDTVFEMIDAMGGRGDERTVQRVAAHPEGRRLFMEKPSLLAALADREALEALPEMSFGREYLCFSRNNGFTADGLLQANRRGLAERNAQLDTDRLWLFERLNLMHDLWHVLTGYDTDPAGETALLAFSIGQGLANRTIHLLFLVGLVIAPKREGLAFQRFALEAYRRGRRTAPLFVQRYEDLLPRSIFDVRRELRIQPIRDAHPEGLFRSDVVSRDMIRVSS